MLHHVFWEAAARGPAASGFPFCCRKIGALLARHPSQERCFFYFFIYSTKLYYDAANLAFCIAAFKHKVASLDFVVFTHLKEAL